jgi:hypothetical protein
MSIRNIRLTIARRASLAVGMVVEPTKLQEHIRATYFSLRFGLGLLAFVFPVFLLLYGDIVEHIPYQTSMSAYYFAFAPEDSPLRVFPMRVFFVGGLWAIGSFLILYRGFSETENWLLNFAGASAIGVAIIPMKAPCANCAIADSSTWHLGLAATLLLLVALVAWFCNEDTLRELEKEQARRKNELEEKLKNLQGESDEKEKLKNDLDDLQKKPKRFCPDCFRWSYRLLGIFMILAPAGGVWVTYVAGIYNWKLYAVEWAGIWIFSFYWWLKSYELYLSRADEKAAMGQMTVTEPVAKVSETIRAGVSSQIANLRKGDRNQSSAK